MECRAWQKICPRAVCCATWACQVLESDFLAVRQRHEIFAGGSLRRARDSAYSSTLSLMTPPMPLTMPISKISDRTTKGLMNFFIRPISWPKSQALSIKCAFRRGEERLGRATGAKPIPAAKPHPSSYFFCARPSSSLQTYSHFLTFNRQSAIGNWVTRTSTPRSDPTPPPSALGNNQRTPRPLTKRLDRLFKLDITWSTQELWNYHYK